MSVSSASSSEAESLHDLSNPDVTTKYRTAGDIANKALQLVMDKCVDGADIHELCELGDACIIDETGKVYNKRVKSEKSPEKEGKKIEKGIGFPTCISVNEIAGHFSPLKGESKILRSGDMVKIDLGAQIDGYIAQGGHTIIIPVSGADSPSRTAALNEQGKISDRRADVLKAAWVAAEAALRTFQVGNTNTQVTQVLQKCADEFKCQPVAGVLSHELKRHVIDGQNCILSKENVNDEQKVDEFDFQLNTVYTLDVLMSSGDGKTREMECRHTVYKRAVETQYILKTQKARQFISEVNKKYPSLPFSLRSIEDEQCARVGVSEAKRHQLLHEYPVLTERLGEFVAQFKFTVLLLPGGTKKITGFNFSQEDMIDSQYTVEDESLKKLLMSSANPRKNKRNKKSKEGKTE